MTQTRDNVWLNRFAWALAVCTVFLVALGGVVTTKGVGMAVPDWPTTYDHHMVTYPPSKWQSFSGLFYEHSHRLWASLVGLLTGVMAIWVWVRETTGKTRTLAISGFVAGLALIGVRTPIVFVVVAALCVFVIFHAAWRAYQDREARMRWLTVIAFAAVIIQGVLGGLRVLLDAHGWGTEFGILHAALAQLFLVLVGSLVLVTSKWWQNRQDGSRGLSLLRGVVLATTVLIFVQLIFGATMRHQHAGLAVPDVPLAYGKIWPATDAASVAAYNQQRIEAHGEEPITAGHIVVHMFHRYMAVLVATLIVVSAVLAFRQTSPGDRLRRWTAMWVGLVLIQVTLGILTITTERNVHITVSHVAVGALTFLVGWISFLVSSLSAAETRDVAAPALLKGAQLKHA